ncbi:MAG: hypothetical protein IANPNBLG_03980 [Bryobacteraceae bacterium]|nr:hypothetical protein [Bryobacteraceae bacterium]
MPRKKPSQPDAGKKARRIARNVIGTVPVEKVILPKTLRKKPKHRKSLERDESQ